MGDAKSTLGNSPTSITFALTAAEGWVNIAAKIVAAMDTYYGALTAPETSPIREEDIFFVEHIEATTGTIQFAYARDAEMADDLIAFDSGDFQTWRAEVRGVENLWIEATVDGTLTVLFYNQGSQ